ncbi:MAG: type II secretion system F family protein [Candidatus Micrarchaeia archaeon]|jgi:flagellar protein FlaJ
MDMKIPLLLMPQKRALAISHPLYRFSARMNIGYKLLEKDLYKLDSEIAATAYLAAVMLNSMFYFVIVGLIAYVAFTRGKTQDAIWWSLALAVFAALAVLFFSIAYPRWLVRKKVASIDKNLLFAARHLRIQTTAGTPLFDSIVSASHGYGEISEEFEKIVANVQVGTSLADALEDSAVRNPSYYYNRILWQMSNAVKSGTDVGPVLSEIVEFLSDEQRIEMRNYGAQLNTLAIMYLMACIIVPTISLIFLMVISSFVDVPITNTFLLFILAGLVFVQYIFIGVIESRRPNVSI